jgi:hypothetical protein
MLGCLAELQPFFREIRRVLAPAGHAVLTFTNRRSHLHRINRLFRKPQGSFRAYSVAEISAELHIAGLRMEGAEYFNSFVDTGKWMIPPKSMVEWSDHHLPRLVAPGIARNAIVVASLESHSALRSMFAAHRDAGCEETKLV